MKTNDIKQIWKSANADEMTGRQYSLNEIQDYRKRKSHQLSRSGSWAIYFDIVFKGLIAFALVYLVIFQVTEPSYQRMMVALTGVTAFLMGMNFTFLKKLKKIKETDTVMENLKSKLHYFETTYRIFILNSSLSNPLFVLTGFFFYFEFKYHEIRPVVDPVLYAFLIAAFFISFGAQWANYRNQVKELNEVIENLDDESIASIKMEEHRVRRRRNLFMYTILIVLGLLLLLYLLL